MTNRILSKLPHSPHDYMIVLQCTKICYPCFCTKLATSRIDLHQGQTEPYTQKSERQPVVSEGIGWAGQPIVRRTHAILPEVYGDVSDVFSALNQLSNSQSIEDQVNLSTQQSKNNNDLYVQNSGPIYIKNSECLNQSSDSEFDMSHHQNLSQSCIECHNNISEMNSYISDKLNTNKEIPSKDLRGQATNFVAQSLNKRKCDYMKLYEEDLMNKTAVKKLKIKMKKRTKVLGVKNIKGLKKEKMVRKKKTKVFSPRRKYKRRSQLALSQANYGMIGHRNKPHINSENFLLAENRHFMTDSALTYPKASTVLLKNKTQDKNKGKPKKENKGKNQSSSEDCVCPEVIEDKHKDKTKICGEAGEGEEKEKKKRKQKMCIIEPIIKRRQKTYVCASIVEKSKKKRQLPKCPEPEKKAAYRTLVCPPQLFEAKSAAEQCVKQVEVKIRKRTKVCKPVIIYAKEEASIKIEKTICTESRVKQTISRHTKVCPPSGKSLEGLRGSGRD